MKYGTSISNEITDDAQFPKAVKLISPVAFIKVGIFSLSSAMFTLLLPVQDQTTITWLGRVYLY